MFFFLILKKNKPPLQNIYWLVYKNQKFLYSHYHMLRYLMHTIANNPMEIYLNTKGKPRTRCPPPQLPTTSYHNNHHHHHQSSREIAWHQIREDYIHDSHIAGSKKLSFGLRRYVPCSFLLLLVCMTAC